MWHTFWHSIWPLRSSGAHWVRRVPGWGPAVLTELGRSQVEVQRCPSWGPAVPTACGSWRGCKGGGGEAGGLGRGRRRMREEEAEEEENNCDKILPPPPGRWEKKMWFVSLTLPHPAWPNATIRLPSVLTHSTFRAGATGRKHVDFWVSPQPIVLTPPNHPWWTHMNKNIRFVSFTPMHCAWAYSSTRGGPTWTKKMWFVNFTTQRTVLDPTQTIRTAIRAAAGETLNVRGFWSQEENILIPESHPPPTVFNHPWWPHMNKKCDLWVSPQHTVFDPSCRQCRHPCWPTQHAVRAPQEQKNVICHSPYPTLLEATQPPVVAPHEQKKMICESHSTILCCLSVLAPRVFTLTPLNH